MKGYDIINVPDAGIEFKKGQRMEICHFIDDLQQISQAINKSKHKDGSSDATIPQGITILDYVEMIKRKIAGVESGK
jgi:hypothetical protein